MTPTGNGPDSGPTKPSNPKDIIGSRKLPVDLVPSTLEVLAAEAFLEGALKYGRYNWRICGVRASIYYAAAERHLKKWWNGQDRDPTTRVKHLSSVLACVGIMLDAELFEKLEDDRPPCPNPDAMARLIDQMEAQVKHLKEVFAEHHPHQFTIADTSVKPPAIEELSLNPTPPPRVILDTAQLDTSTLDLKPGALVYTPNADAVMFESSPRIACGCGWLGFENQLCLVHSARDTEGTPCCPVCKKEFLTCIPLGLKREIRPYGPNERIHTVYCGLDTDHEGFCRAVTVTGRAESVNDAIDRLAETAPSTGHSDCQRSASTHLQHGQPHAEGQPSSHGQTPAAGAEAPRRGDVRNLI